VLLTINLKNAVDGYWLMVHGAKTRVTTPYPYTRRVPAKIVACSVLLTINHKPLTAFCRINHEPLTINCVFWVEAKDCKPSFHNQPFAYVACILTVCKEYRDAIMPSSTLTSKGQITVPKLIREHLHVAEGDQVDFAIAINGDVVMHRITGSVSTLAGFLHRPNRKPVSLAAMDNAILGSVIDKLATLR